MPWRIIIDVWRKKATPLCNVENAGNTAKLVALANQSLYQGELKTWKG